MSEKSRQFGRHTRQCDCPQGASNRLANRQQPRSPSPSSQSWHLTKRRIAAEKLISSQPRERNLEAEFRRRVTHQVRVQPVNRRLIHAIKKVVEDGFEFRTADAMNAMLESKAARGCLGERCFVIISAGIFVESESNAL